MSNEPNPALGFNRTINFDASRANVVWDCPYCGWRMADCAYMSVRFDYGCARCKTPLAHFKSKVLTPAPLHRRSE